MSDSEQSLSGRESLDIIHEMINKAKGNIRGGAFHFLMWGWIILAGSLGHYLLLEFSTIKHPEWAWLVIIVGIAGSILKGFRERNERRALTYSSRIYTTVWITFLINYFIIVLFGARINFLITPLVLMMAAGATYLSGSIIRFNPLKWGAIFIWIMAILSFTVSLPYQLLASAAAVGLGYLIPGYMLQKSED